MDGLGNPSYGLPYWQFISCWLPKAATVHLAPGSAAR